MEVVDGRSALLSNFEVLTLLKELEKEQVGKAKANFLVKKEQSTNDEPKVDIMPEEEIAENLRTIEYEIIQYLTTDYQPLRRQSEKSVRALTRGLRQFELTKAEKLQIVNLAPTEPVELYVIVEELEDRLTSMESVLELVKSTLSDEPDNAEFNLPFIEPSQIPTTSGTLTENNAMQLEDEYYQDQEESQEMVHEAGGFEGDLEMGDDDE